MDSSEASSCTHYSATPSLGSRPPLPGLKDNRTLSPILFPAVFLFGVESIVSMANDGGGVSRLGHLT